MELSETLLRFGREYCKSDSKDERKPLRTILETNYRNAFELADKLAVVLNNYFETGQGMSESEAVTTANTIAHLLHAGNDSVAAWMKIKETHQERKKTHTLRQCLAIAYEYYPIGKKIEAIKEIRKITNCDLAGMKEFVENVWADIASGKLTEQDI